MLPQPQPRPTEDVPTVYLSPMERRIIGEITRTGAPSTLIARRMGITINTFKTHLKRIHIKVDRLIVHEHTVTALVILLLKGQLKVRTCMMPSVHNGDRPVSENHYCQGT